MKRMVILAILKMCGEAILLTMIAGIVIGVIGNRNQWNTSIAYSNAFFIAGCLMIVAGAASRLGSGQGTNNSQLLYVKSIRNMSSGERADFIINASSSGRVLILGLLSGILLILISVLVAKMF